MPQRDVYVSQQHRVLVRSKIALSIFGTEQVLVAAKHLLAVDGIDVAVECAEVEYFHFALDNHSIVFANGIETESLYLGTQALRMLSEESRRELSLIFPEVEGNLPVAQAATFASGQKARSLAARHQQERRSLVSRPERMLRAVSE